MAGPPIPTKFYSPNPQRADFSASSFFGKLGVEKYVQAYTSCNEHTGEVDDTLDVVVRGPGGDEWFSCTLTPETRAALKEKMELFCVEQYGEHLPGQDSCTTSQPELLM